MKIVAVTACPTGVAHTLMAAEALKKTAAVMGHDLRVETQGSGNVYFFLLRILRLRLSTVTDEFADNTRRRRWKMSTA